MAKGNIKGLTVEIGGDTTKLGQALEGVNKKSRDLSAELGQINKLLKLDPGNTDLLAQKQRVLAETIATTADKLDTLKKAERQVQEQFARGEVSEEQVRALQREIIDTEKQLDKYKKSAADAAQGLDALGDSTEKVEKSSGGLGRALGSIAKTGLAAVATMVAAAGTALVASAEATREYRTEMGKLETAFTTAGHSSEAALGTYKELQGVLGETDRAVEAANHLAKLTKSEQELQKWTDICTGVYATFGASLPIEGLTEAANETAKVGKVTGPLADALNWAGVNEDAFNESLAACTSEQERQTLIMETLNGLYDDAATKYRETNAEVIRANEANEAWTSSLAEVGGAIEPILTDVKSLGASLLNDLVPGVKTVAESFRGILNGDDGAGAELGEAISGIATQVLTKITDLLPQAAEAGTALVTSLASSIIGQIPAILDTGVQVIKALLDGVTTALPEIAGAVADMIPKLVDTLVAGIPQIIKGAVTLLLAIVDAIDQILPPLIKALPAIIMCIINGLLNAIPQLIEGALTLLLAIVDAIPLLIEQLVPLIPTIVIAVCDALLDATPQLIQAGEKLLGALAKAIPSACVALLKQLPQLWTTISGYLKQLPEKVMIIGGDLIKGFWKGIQDKAAWLKEKITGWVGDVTEFLKNLFGIHSPSKVTAWMGEMLDEGLAVGIEDNAGAPKKAMSALSSELVHEAGHVDGVAIERQVSHAYSVSAAASTAQSASVLGKLDQILEAIARGQIITIDGNALVGATANKMNNALGQRRILAERGAV